MKRILQSAIGLIAFALLMLWGATGFAQTPIWVTIAIENQSVSVTFPTAVAACQFGSPADNKWSAPFAVAAGTTYKELYWPFLTSPTTSGALAGATGQFPFADPDPGVFKTLQCAEQASAYTISTPGGKTPTVTVPALPVVVVTPPATSNYTYGYTLTLDATGKVIGASCTSPAVTP
jgi:hypothetical protein